MCHLRVSGEPDEVTNRAVFLPAALQLDVQSCEWLHADHVVHHSCCIRVVCAIVEFVNVACRVLKALVPCDKKKR